MKFTKLYAIFMISVFLLGCGQSGALYLPSQNEAPQKVKNSHEN